MDTIAQRSAADIIDQFDVVYDMPLRQHEATGELEKLGAFGPTAPPAIQVGAVWCRIVQADVHYALEEALRLIDRSRAPAEALAARADLDDFERYVATRWLDGAGRIHYRCTDSTIARMYFARAEELAPQRCKADVASNGLRSRFEEQKIAGDDLTRLLDPMEAAYKAFSALTPADLGSDLHWREHRRGLCNLLHNLSMVLPIVGRGDEALPTSEKATEIALSLNDGYRLPQTLNYQAQVLAKAGKLAPAWALYEQVTTLGWVRGQRIARQNLGDLDRRLGKEAPAERPERYRRALETLLDLLSEQGDGSPELDHDFFAYTVGHLEKLLDPKESPGIEAVLGDDLSPALERLDALQLDTIRRLRRVVKIGHYKASFAKNVEPRYQKRVAQLLLKAEAAAEEGARRRGREDAAALIEEATGRELLDVLAAASVPPGTGAASLPALAWAEVAEDGLERRRSSLRRGARLSEEAQGAFDDRRRWYESEALRQPVASQPHDPEIAHRVRMFTASQPGLALVRFFSAQGRHGAFVFRDGEVHQVDLPDVGERMGGWRALIDEDRDEKGRPRGRPSCRVAEELSDALLAPIWPHLRQPTPVERLVIVPTGPLFDLPLHIAFEPGTRWPLAASFPLCFSVSATAFVARGRHLLARQPTEPDDDLCALLHLDERATGGELLQVPWAPERFHIAGTPPVGLPRGAFTSLGPANWAGIEAIVQEKPEFFVYAGHGLTHRELASLSSGGEGAGLQLDGDLLTQFDVALRMRLPRNKFTLLGACLSGRGTASIGGEVAGFIRAFTLAGSGAIATTLWPVEDEQMVEAGRSILQQIARAVADRTSFDIVELVHQAAVRACRMAETAQDRIEGCPLALYL